LVIQQGSSVRGGQDLHLLAESERVKKKNQAWASVLNAGDGGPSLGPQRRPRGAGARQCCATPKLTKQFANRRGGNRDWPRGLLGSCLRLPLFMGPRGQGKVHGDFFLPTATHTKKCAGTCNFRRFSNLNGCKTRIWDFLRHPSNPGPLGMVMAFTGRLRAGIVEGERHTTPRGGAGRLGAHHLS